MAKTTRTPASGRSQPTNSSQGSSSNQNQDRPRPTIEWEGDFNPEDYVRVPNPFPGLIPENPNSPIFTSNEQGEYNLGDSMLGIEIESISISGCHICITFNYTIGFIQYPSSTVCYIKPECQTQEDSSQLNQTNPDEPEYPLPPRVPDFEREINLPAGEHEIIQGSQCQGVWCYYYNQTPRCDAQSDSTESRYKIRCEGIVSWGATTTTFVDGSCISIKQIWWIKFAGQFIDVAVPIASGGYSNYRRIQLPHHKKISISGYTFFGAIFGELISGQGDLFRCRDYSHLPSGKWRYNFCNHTIRINDQLYELQPPLPPSPKQSMSKCCPNNERLLRLILRRIGEPKKVTVPVHDKTEERRIASLIQAIETWSTAQSKNSADLYKVIEPRAFEGASYPMRLTHAGAKGDKPIRNYLQAWEAILRQIDTAVGLLPFKLKIEDTNAAQQGNQSIEIQVHSISDALKLLIENVIDIEGDGDTTNNLLVRMAAMLIQQHQVLAKVNAQTRNTEEFLDYKVKQKFEKIPVTLNPLLPAQGEGFGNATSLDRNTERATEDLMPHLLKNTELSVKVTEIDEKKLLSEWLYSIEKFSAASAAGNTVHYKGKETLEKLINSLLENDEMKEFLERKNIRKAIGESADLSKFEQDAEKGYPSFEGLVESDPNKPYGKPQSKRPKFKKTRRRR